MVETLAPVSGKKPVIGLAGFFGYGNYGDELFVSVFKEYLSDKFDLKFISDEKEKPYYSRPIAEHVAEVDAIVIGGGDIVQPWGIDTRYFSREFLAKPIFVVGVGVPIRKGLPAGSYHVEKDWIVKKYNDFFNHPNVKMVHARDPQSSKWIKSRLDPEVGMTEGPDIVCALTFPEAQKPEGAPILGIVTRQRPGQEDDYSQINALAQQQIGKGWRIRHIILGSDEVGRRDLLDAVDVTGMKETVYSEKLDDLSTAIGECTALISMKFHGSVAATMYGVPSTVLIPTNKNRNFMRRIGRDELLSQFDDETLCARFAETAPAPIATEKVDLLRSTARQVMLQLEQKISEAMG